jgi:hypothetical protein
VYVTVTNNPFWIRQVSFWLLPSAYIDCLESRVSKRVDIAVDRKIDTKEILVSINIDFESLFQIFPAFTPLKTMAGSEDHFEDTQCLLFERRGVIQEVTLKIQYECLL